MRDASGPMDGDKRALSDCQTRFVAILNDATTLYHGSSPGSLADFMQPPMKSVEDLVHQLDLRNQQFSHFRALRQSICDTLLVALRPVELVGTMAAGAAQEVFAPSQNIFCAVMYLITAAHDVSSIYDSILDLFAQLKDFTSRLDIYIKTEMSPALHQKLVEILACLFEVLVLATQQVRRGRFKAYFKRLFGSESPVQPALDKLESLTLGEERQAIADTYSGVMQIDTKTDRVESMVGQISEDIRDLKLQGRGSETDIETLKTVLEPSPYPEDFYASMVKYRVDGTGDWILEDETVQAWVHGDVRHLWICGSPGTGKSFLSARLVSWAAENLHNVGYFFFRNNYPETRSVVQALRDVAYQLCENNERYASRLAEKVSRKEDIKTVASAYRRLFVEPLVSAPKNETVYILLDGIDESDFDEMKQLLSQLYQEEDSVKPDRNFKVQVALIGRSYLSDTIATSLDPTGQGGRYQTVNITSERTADDVRIYISDQISNSRLLSHTADDFKKEVIEALQKRVDGLFVLAKFMLVEINRKRHPRSILKTLETYPHGVYAMLQATLLNLASTISEEEVNDLNEMLQWVACAEDALTLEQLEAALVLRFGDPPIRLEEALRCQYACFFDLEREDGLTTDDLMKDYERSRRRPSHDGSPLRYSSPLRRLEMADGDARDGRQSPSAKVKPIGIGRPNRSASPAVHSLSPRRRDSPARSPDFLDIVTEMEFRSNKQATFVTFPHASVGEFFRDKNVESKAVTETGTAIGFDIASARLHVLKTCLRVLTDREWLESCDLSCGKDSLRQYAAWYWQEHLTAVSPDDMSANDRRVVGRQIYKMLTDEETIFAWSILYEKNDEGLEVFTEANLKGLQAWMSNDKLQNDLEEDAKKWAQSSSSISSGLVEKVGRLYAKAWLSEAFDEYVPTAFCFKIVQNAAFIEEGYSWSDADRHWFDISVEDRIAKATKWAGYPQTAYWHRRVGSTFLTQDLHDKALTHYREALRLDDNSVRTTGRIAYCLFRNRRYEEAAEQALACAEIEEQDIASGELNGFALTSSKWRLYKDQYLIAQSYRHLGKTEQSLMHFRKAIGSAANGHLLSSERFEPETAYLKLMSRENMYAEALELLHEMAFEMGSGDDGHSRLVEFLLHQCTKFIAIDWIPRAACKENDVDFVLEALEAAMETAARQRAAVAILHLRIAVGTTMHFLRDDAAALEIFERISLLEYRPRGKVQTRKAHDVAFDKLATIYKQKALRSDSTSEDQGKWIFRLENLCKIQVGGDRSSSSKISIDLRRTTLASVSLAMFYDVLGRKEESRSMQKSMILDCLDRLSSERTDHSLPVLDNLLRVLIIARDTDNAFALCQSMRHINPKVAALSERSPIAERREPRYLRVPACERSCALCLDCIRRTDEFYFCHACLDSFCSMCVLGLLEEHKGTQEDDLVCQPDHQRLKIPPLSQPLHGDEILMQGKVEDFEVWKERIRRSWIDMESISA